MPIRLSTTTSGAWHPILTFERRRLDLLDWAEGSVAYTGFVDNQNKVGLDLAHGLRVEFDRASFIVSSVLPTRDLDLAEPLVGAAFDILAPRHPTIIIVRSQWCAPVDLPYDIARQILAGKIAFGEQTRSGDGVLAVDSSVLLDVIAESADIQVEYGLVTRDELLQRLTDPNLGRVRGLPKGRTKDLQRENLGETSLYFAVSWVPTIQATVVTPADVLQTTANAIDQSQFVVDTLIKHLLHDLGVEDEFSGGRS